MFHHLLQPDLRAGLVLSLVALASSVQAAPAASHWTVTDLGTLGGTTSAGNAINNAGQVTGYATTGAATVFGAITTVAGGKIILSSNSGTTFYDGGLSVGGSPGLGLDEGDVSFGSGITYLTEIGGTSACTLACALTCWIGTASSQGCAA
jgi:hypothetical protein